MNLSVFMRRLAESSVAVFIACSAPQTAQTLRQRSADSWQYPIHLGDTRAKVHEFLTNPSRNTGILEEYPTSGVTALFDEDGRVSRISFYGPACRIYSEDPANNFPATQPILFGLTGETNLDGFRRILGKPMTETGGPWQSDPPPSNAPSLKCTWKKGGYVVVAEFLPQPWADQLGKTYPKGTLFWFEVTKGLP